MKHNGPKIIALFFLYVYFAGSCGKDGIKTEHPAATTALGLKSVTTNLPEAAGYQTFKTNCNICHSARYVEMQPDFPEKTWAAIVGKMKNTYGAPVTDSAAKVIVQYLVSIKGEK